MAFKFEFSLHVLDHLGRGLYRSYATVIAEAISNAWDADAETVHIETTDNSLTIWDDGVGMDSKDFQNKFLKIGYMRRDMSKLSDGKKRRVLGRKGIGKLSYLSLSDKITVITKKKGAKRIAVVMDNNGITKAIEKNSNAPHYILPNASPAALSLKKYKIEKSGTQLVFERLRKNLRKKNIRTILATQFHFAQTLKKDDKFEIFVNGKKINLQDFGGIYDNAQYAWFLDEQSERDFFADLKDNGIHNVKFEKSHTFTSQTKKNMPGLANARGYIISVKKPSHLFIDGKSKDIKASVSLFANGRLRESDLIAKISRSQLHENYLLGQIHYDLMDQNKDRFTSARDGVIEDDELYNEFMGSLRKVLTIVTNEWNKWRKETGDVIDKEKGRKSYAEKAKDSAEEMMVQIIKSSKSIKYRHYEKYPITEIRQMARENFPSYGYCFLAENLMRCYVINNDLLRLFNAETIEEYRERVKRTKRKAQIKYPIRKHFWTEENCRNCGKCDNCDISNMASQDMAPFIDRKMGSPSDMRDDAKRQKPIRDALMHTAVLTDTAKQDGSARWENIVSGIMDWVKTNKNH